MMLKAILDSEGHSHTDNFVARMSYYFCGLITAMWWHSPVYPMFNKSKGTNQKPQVKASLCWLHFFSFFFWIISLIRLLALLLFSYMERPGVNEHLASLGYMMTSSNGNIFRVTGHLCRESTGHRWIPSTKASDAELWCFLWSVPE